MDQKRYVLLQIVVWAYAKSVWKYLQVIYCDLQKILKPKTLVGTVTHYALAETVILSNNVSLNFQAVDTIIFFFFFFK